MCRMISGNTLEMAEASTMKLMTMSRIAVVMLMILYLIFSTASPFPYLGNGDQAPMMLPLGI